MNKGAILIFGIVMLIMFAGCDDDSTSPEKKEWVEIDGYDFEAYIGDFNGYTHMGADGDLLTPIDSLDWHMEMVSGRGVNAGGRYVYVDSFYVYQFSEDNCSIHWETDYENNMLGYHLRRSLQPAYETSIPITFDIIPSGNYTESHLYSYMDEGLHEGFIYYYWLLAYTDGVETPEITGPASIDFGEIAEPASYPRVFPAYPNSFHDSFTIGFTVNSQAWVVIVLIDEDGELVRGIVDSQVNAGWHTVTATGIEAEAGELLRLYYYIKVGETYYRGYGDMMVN